MAQTLNLIAFLASIIGVIAIVLGIDASRKVSGQLKTLLILIILTTAVFTIGEIIKTLNGLEVLQMGYPENIIKIVLAVFFFITIICIKSVIEHLSKLNYREKIRKK